MADSVEVSTIETTDGTIGVIRDNAARQSIANLREGKETVGSVAWENVKGRPTKVSSFENDKKYQTDENVSNTLNSTLYAGSSTHGGPATSADKLTTARTISLGGAASGSGSFDGSANSTINVSSLDATKLTGVVPITNLPPSVVERMSIVKDDTERFALTTDTVQDGDVVKVKSSGLMYYVVDDTKLNEDTGYEVFTVGTAASVPWGGVTDKPSTFPPSSHTHTKSQITDFPSSMPNPNNLTMQIEGNDAAVYNGGTAQTFNVTKSALGLDKVNNTADADKSVKYAASADAADSIKAYTTRPASANNVFGDGKLRYFLATSSMTEGKPTAGDAKVLDLAWDNTNSGGWDAQIAIPTEGPLQIRSMERGTWQPWKAVAYKSETQPVGYYLTAAECSGTVDDLIKQRSGTSGGMGSISLVQKSSGVGSEIPAGWYNYFYSPHRTGIGDDNYLWASIILTPMTFSGDSYILRIGFSYDTNEAELVEVRNINSPEFLSATDKSVNVATVPFYSYWQLNREFGTGDSTDTETFLKNWVKKIVKSHSNLSSVNIIASANPNWEGSIIFRAYSCTDYNGTGMPQHCKGIWISTSKNNIYEFGTNKGIWFMNILGGSGSKSVASTLLASGWQGSAAPYTYDLGSTYANKSVMIGYDGTKYSEDSMTAASDADIVGGEGTVIYAYGEKPTVDIPIIIQYS